jgi:hypothetical protein
VLLDVAGVVEQRERLPGRLVEASQPMPSRMARPVAWPSTTSRMFSAFQPLAQQHGADVLDVLAAADRVDRSGRR